MAQLAIEKGGSYLVCVLQSSIEVPNISTPTSSTNASFAGWPGGGGPSPINSPSIPPAENSNQHSLRACRTPPLSSNKKPTSNPDGALVLPPSYTSPEVGGQPGTQQDLDSSLGSNPMVETKSSDAWVNADPAILLGTSPDPTTKLGERSSSLLHPCSNNAVTFAQRLGMDLSPINILSSILKRIYYRCRWSFFTPGLRQTVMVWSAPTTTPSGDRPGQSLSSIAEFVLWAIAEAMEEVVGDSDTELGMESIDEKTRSIYCDGGIKYSFKVGLAEGSAKVLKPHSIPARVADFSGNIVITGSGWERACRMLPYISNLCFGVHGNVAVNPAFFSPSIYAGNGSSQSDDFSYFRVIPITTRAFDPKDNSALSSLVAASSPMLLGGGKAYTSSTTFSSLEAFTTNPSDALFSLFEEASVAITDRLFTSDTQVMVLMLVELTITHDNMLHLFADHEEKQKEMDDDEEDKDIDLESLRLQTIEKDSLSLLSHLPKIQAVCRIHDGYLSSVEYQFGIIPPRTTCRKSSPSSRKTSKNRSGNTEESPRLQQETAGREEEEGGWESRLAVYAVFQDVNGHIQGDHLLHCATQAALQLQETFRHHHRHHQHMMLMMEEDEKVREEILEQDDDPSRKSPISSAQPQQEASQEVKKEKAQEENAHRPTKLTQEDIEESKGEGESGGSSGTSSETSSDTEDEDEDDITPISDCQVSICFGSAPRRVVAGKSFCGGEGMFKLHDLIQSHRSQTGYNFGTHEKFSVLCDEGCGFSLRNTNSSCVLRFLTVPIFSKNTSPAVSPPMPPKNPPVEEVMKLSDLDDTKVYLPSLSFLHPPNAQSNNLLADVTPEQPRRSDLNSFGLFFTGSLALPKQILYSSDTSIQRNISNSCVDKYWSIGRQPQTIRSDCHSIRRLTEAFITNEIEFLGFEEVVHQLETALCRCIHAESHHQLLQKAENEGLEERNGSNGKTNDDDDDDEGDQKVSQNEEEGKGITSLDQQVGESIILTNDHKKPQSGASISKWQSHLFIVSIAGKRKTGKTLLLTRIAKKYGLFPLIAMDCSGCKQHSMDAFLLDFTTQVYFLLETRTVPGIDGYLDRLQSLRAVQHLTHASTHSHMARQQKGPGVPILSPSHTLTQDCLSLLVQMLDLAFHPHPPLLPIGHTLLCMLDNAGMLDDVECFNPYASPFSSPFISRSNSTANATAVMHRAGGNNNQTARRHAEVLRQLFFDVLKEKLKGPLNIALVCWVVDKPCIMNLTTTNSFLSSKRGSSPPPFGMSEQETQHELRMKNVKVACHEMAIVLPSRLSSASLTDVEQFVRSFLQNQLSALNLMELPAVMKLVESAGNEQNEGPSTESEAQLHNNALLFSSEKDIQEFVIAHIAKVLSHVVQGSSFVLSEFLQEIKKESLLTLLSLPSELHQAMYLRKMCDFQLIAVRNASCKILRALTDMERRILFSICFCLVLLDPSGMGGHAEILLPCQPVLSELQCLLEGIVPSSFSASIPQDQSQEDNIQQNENDKHSTKEEALEKEKEDGDEAYLYAQSFIDIILHSAVLSSVIELVYDDNGEGRRGGAKGGVIGIKLCSAMRPKLIVALSDPSEVSTLAHLCLLKRNVAEATTPNNRCTNPADEGGKGESTVAVSFLGKLLSLPRNDDVDDGSKMKSDDDNLASTEGNIGSSHRRIAPKLESYLWCVIAASRCRKASLNAMEGDEHIFQLFQRLASEITLDTSIKDKNNDQKNKCGGIHDAPILLCFDVLQQWEILPKQFNSSLSNVLQTINAPWSSFCLNRADVQRMLTTTTSGPVEDSEAVDWSKLSFTSIDEVLCGLVNSNANMTFMGGFDPSSKNTSASPGSSLSSSKKSTHRAFGVMVSTETQIPDVDGALVDLHNVVTEVGRIAAGLTASSESSPLSATCIPKQLVDRVTQGWKCLESVLRRMMEINHEMPFDPRFDSELKEMGKMIGDWVRILAISPTPTPTGMSYSSVIFPCTPLTNAPPRHVDPNMQWSPFTMTSEGGRSQSSGGMFPEASVGDESFGSAGSEHSPSRVTTDRAAVFTQLVEIRRCLKHLVTSASQVASDIFVHPVCEKDIERLQRAIGSQIHVESIRRHHHSLGDILGVLFSFRQQKKQQKQQTASQETEKENITTITHDVGRPSGGDECEHLLLIPRCIQKAVHYMYYEFLFEESLMASLAYPTQLRSQHQYAHRKILATLLDIDKQFRFNPVAVDDDLVRVLLHTVQLHLAWADVQFCKFVAANVGDVGYQCGNLLFQDRISVKNHYDEYFNKSNSSNEKNISGTDGGGPVLKIGKAGGGKKDSSNSFVSITISKVESTTRVATSSASAPALQTSSKGWKPKFARRNLPPPPPED